LPGRSSSRRLADIKPSDLHDFCFLMNEEGIYLLREIIRQLLQPVFGLELHVLGKIVLLQGGLDVVLCMPADVSDGHL